MGLFSFLKKKKVEEKTVETVSKIQFEQLYDAEDTYLTKLATNVINGMPLIVNLESLSIDDANKVIAFLSGVVYAIEGEILNLKEKVFMFGNSEVYQDGTVKVLIDEIS